MINKEDVATNPEKTAVVYNWSTPSPGQLSWAVSITTDASFKELPT